MDRARAGRRVAGSGRELREAGCGLTLLDALLPRCTFPADGPVTCAVSGGADSLALLALAAASRDPRDVVAIHLDHGLRPGSEMEAEIVATASARFGAQFRSERIVVEPGPNLEARARKARFEVLPPDACTGHTADDQAETVLLALLRGAGLDGLAGMRPGPRHPILRLRRAETHSLCDSLGVEVVHDPTNEDRLFRRNAVRHDLVPLLDRIAERDVAGLLAREAELIRADADLLDELAAAIDVTDARALAAAPVPLARRAVRGWLRPYFGGHPPDAGAIERVLAVARGERRACDVAEGVRVLRSARRLSLSLP